MVEPTIAFLRKERVLVQPRGGREQFRHGNHGIVLAIAEEHRNVEFSHAIVRRRGSRNSAGRKKTGQRNRRRVAFRVHAQQVNRQQTALRKTNRHHGTVVGNVRRNPIVDCFRCGECVTVQILAGIHTIMQPRVRAGCKAASRLQRQRRAQRGEIVVWRDVAHHVGQVRLVRPPAVQTQEQRSFRRGVAAAARILHMRDLQRFTETSRHHVRFAADQLGLIIAVCAACCVFDCVAHDFQYSVRLWRTLAVRKDP